MIKKYSNIYSRRSTRIHSRKTKTTIKPKQKKHKITKGGGTPIGLDISYDNGNIIIHKGDKGDKGDKSDNGNDLTNEYNAGKLNTAPEIKFNGALDNTTYLVVMYDPDAPYGNDNNGNHIYTHWIFTYKTSNQGGGTEIKDILEYRPPSPPYGTHRYIFKLYNNLQVNETEIKNLINSNENTKLPLKAINLLEDNMFYTVNSGKEWKIMTKNGK